MNNFKRNIFILAAIAVTTIFLSAKISPVTNSSDDNKIVTTISNQQTTKVAAVKTDTKTADKPDNKSDSSVKNKKSTTVKPTTSYLPEPGTTDYSQILETPSLEDNNSQSANAGSSHGYYDNKIAKSDLNESTNNNSQNNDGKQSYSKITSNKKYLSKNVQTGKTNTKIVLQNIELDEKTVKELNDIVTEIRLRRKISGPVTFQPKNTNEFDVDLGMGNVPVLNQGAYGTCVTFTVTALLNAKMNAGDYVSQQCLLGLGNTIQSTESGQMSGWNGLRTIETALNRIKSYGVIGKSTCPVKYANPYSSRTYTNYTNLSGNAWSSNFTWKKLKTKSIDEVKAALNRNNRVAIATILHTDYTAGSPFENYSTGLWKLPDDLNKFMSELYSGKIGGHAVIVTGYDDEKQLLKIRNSWGTGLGAKGEYYMTYEYYNLLNYEAIEVI